VVGRIIAILGDQLSHDISSLQGADPDRDVIVMAEVMGEATYVPHHPKKIILILSAMRKFAAQLRDQGWRVLYTELDDPDSSHTLTGEILRRAAETGFTDICVTEPTEWRVIDALADLPLRVDMRPDTRFIASHAEFKTWAQGRKALRMEYFYRDMRRKTGLLMQGDTPEGGQWNFDHDNRKAPPKSVAFAGPRQFTTDTVTQSVIQLVQDRFGDNFGRATPFWFATDRTQALEAMDHFMRYALPNFGDYQDAMLNDNAFLYHSFLAPYINIGLLSPREVCDAAQAEWQRGHAPINAVEGFIRQIIGWREYVRCIYFLKGRDYTASNHLGHSRDLPAMYWGAPTRMNCMAKSIQQTRDDAYAHHIQRLMVTGNFALLAGIDPHQVHEWYLSVYTDAFEWVEAPNTIGMSQFADGGVIASKPYVSSGAYINRMSDYCKSCHYRVKDRTGDRACPFNALYWGFLDRHRDKFANNPRMAQMYRTFAKMSDQAQQDTLEQAQKIWAVLDAGDTL